MRVNASATILKRDCHVKSRNAKEVQFVFGQMNFFFAWWIYEWCVSGGVATLFPDFSVKRCIEKIE